jgi:DNA-binding MarR family transcriptional regulator
MRTLRDPFDNATDALERRVAAGLVKVSLALKHHAWRRANPRGLTPTQAQVLTTLRSARAGLRLAEVADRLAVTAATASEAVGALVRKGLVRKTPDAADLRSLSITLTPTGRKEADRAAGWLDVLLEAVGTLSPAEQAVFLRALVKTIRTLQDRGRIPISQMCVTCRFFRPYAHPDPERPHHCAFVDAPFGDRHLRLDCPDHQPADARSLEQIWTRFAMAEAHSSGQCPGGGRAAARGLP